MKKKTYKQLKKALMKRAKEVDNHSDYSTGLLDGLNMAMKTLNSLYNKRYKAGQIVKIVNNKSMHGFEIGEKVTLVEISVTKNDTWRAENANTYWWVCEDDIEK